MSEQKFTFGEFVLMCQNRVNDYWSVYQYGTEDGSHVYMIGGAMHLKKYYDFLPYKGNEHLLGTTDDPKPKWTPKRGEVVRVSDFTDAWVYRRFKEMTDSGRYECYWDGGSSTETRSWEYCEPLNEEEKGNG